MLRLLVVVKSLFIGLLVTAMAFGNGALAKAQQPNVLFITIDDLNNWTGALKLHPQAHTPNLDKLADQGFHFTNAHTSAPVCIASRTSFLSGVAPHVSGVYTNGDFSTNAHEAVSDVPHLPELFRQNGYQTLAAGKIYHKWVSDGGKEVDAKMWDLHLPQDYLYPTEEMLKDGNHYRGYKFYPFPEGGTRLVKELGVTRGQSLSAGAISREYMQNGLMPDEVIAEWGVNQLQQLSEAASKSEHAPFFMMLGFLRPHVPFTAPKSYFERFPLESIELPKVDDMMDIPLYGKAMTLGLIPGGDHKAVKTLGTAFWKQLIQGYLASISFVDDQVGRVLNQLEKSGLSQDTLVLVTSDHGQNLGEKQAWRKMNLWRESTQVPLMIKLPQPAGQHKVNTIDAAVSLLDLYPTLVSQLNLPRQHHLDGRDLSPLLTEKPVNWPHPVLVSWKYKNYAVVSERYRYIEYRDGSAELYDFISDPTESNNLVNSEDKIAVKRWLQSYLPVKVALPHGKSKWEGDDLDQQVVTWQQQDTHSLSANNQ